MGSTRIDEGVTGLEVLVIDVETARRPCPWSGSTRRVGGGWPHVTGTTLGPCRHHRRGPGHGDGRSSSRWVLRLRAGRLPSPAGTAMGWSAASASASTSGAWPTCGDRRGSLCPWPSASADAAVDAGSARTSVAGLLLRFPTVTRTGSAVPDPTNANDDLGYHRST